MVLWFKKSNPDTFTFNIDKLRKDLDQLSSALYQVRESNSYEITRKVIKIAKNINALSVGRLKESNEVQFYKHLGRIQAFDELEGLLDQLIEEGKRRARGEKPEHKRSMVRQRGEYDRGATEF